MSDHLKRAAFLLAAIVVQWWGYSVFTSIVQSFVQLEQRVADPQLRMLFGHWFTWQLPGVLCCLVVWIVGERLGLMPSIRRALAFGDPRRTVESGLMATAAILAVTFLLGGVLGSFQFQPPFVKMLGDAVSNMYEEFVFRGFLFCAFYGAVAGTTFTFEGRLHRWGLFAGIVGSGVLFAMGHTQYPVPLRVFLGLISVLFAWPWIRARSLWAPWIMHQLGDMVGDTFVKL